MVLIEIRRRRSWETLISVIGPGGVGKSTVGALLAGRLGWDLIDLDLTFCDCVGTIGPYIGDRGYEAYRSTNLALAEALVSQLERPTIFVTSSGFLAAPKETDDHRRALSVLRTGYSVTLLPSLDVNLATGIVVERQVNRPFGFVAESEAHKFQSRFATYREAGDMLVASFDPPHIIVDAMVGALDFS